MLIEVQVFYRLIFYMFFLIIIGQYLRLHAPSVEKVYIANETFIVPRADSTHIVVGSVYQEGRSDTEISSEDTESLLKRCEGFVPDIRQAHIVKVDVGVRPGRLGGHRCEFGWVEDKGKYVPIIHNYGHGPKGISLHWGSALEALRLYEVLLKKDAKQLSTL